MLSLLTLALAGDVALYERTLALVEEHYLRPGDLDRRAMFADAGRQLENSIEWLLVTESLDSLELRDGQGDWQTSVPLEADDNLPVSLGALEDAIRDAKRPLPEGVDPRVEILRGVVRSLDRHSVVLHAHGLARFDERLSGTLVGIGARFTRIGGELVATEISPGSPADRAGMLPEDRLLKIDGVSTVGMLSGDVSERIRGPADSAVRITLRRRAEVLEMVLMREEVRIRNVTSSVGPGGFGVVRIEHFSDQTHLWLEKSLAELEETGALADGLVVDIRGNTGGSLLQSAEAADTFLEGGRIVSTVGRNGEVVAGLVERLDAHPDQPARTMPLVVLMDHSTASGSEILAGSLATLGRSILVGTTSFGKGTVQKVYQVAPDIKLKLTVGEYLLAGGRRVVDVGSAPDLALAPFRFGPNGVWYAEPGRERARIPSTTPILPAVEEAPGWRTDKSPQPPRDVALDIAARLLLAAEGASRSRLLDTLTILRVRLEDDEDNRVVNAFGARGIDWSAPPSTWSPGDPLVHVRADFHDPPVAGRSTQIVASIRNEGTDLYRAAIRLRSSNRLWDDLVLPLGRVNAGSARTGTVLVDVPPGTPGRVDDVDLLLEAAGLPARLVGRARVQIATTDPPLVVASARMSSAGRTATVAVTLVNESAELASGVGIRLEFPSVAGIELVDDSAQALDLRPGESKTFLFRLSIGENWREPVVPLTIDLTADGAGSFGRWAIKIPRDGSALHIAPPMLDVRTDLVAGPGQTTLSIRASDDRGLDHVVIRAGVETVDRRRYEPEVIYTSDKLAYRAGLGKREELSIPVPVRDGVNRYEVIAEDRAGLRTARTVYVLGDEGEVSVDEVQSP